MLSLKLRIFQSDLTPSNAILQEYLSPLAKYCPSHVHITQTNAPLKKGEPLLGFCLTGGTEAKFLKAALENPTSPAIILVHDRANSYAAGCELSARLNYETKIGNRAPSIFCSINDRESVNSIIRAAASASSFINKPKNLGIIGDPSPWLIMSGNFAKDLPSLFHINPIQIPIQTVIDLFKQNNSIEKSLDHLISQFKLDAFTIRCFDLLPFRCTSCREVSKFNDNGIVSACEGDIASAVTMMVMNSLSQSPVFMANATGFLDDHTATFAHCTIPEKLCTQTKITTHYESGIGHAICGKVKEGIWTMARFGPNGELMSDLVDVSNPRVPSPHHCRTQILVKPSQKTLKKLKRGDVLGNHFLFVPGKIRDELRIFAKLFQKWK